MVRDGYVLTHTEEAGRRKGSEVFCAWRFDPTTGRRRRLFSSPDFTNGTEGGPLISSALGGSYAAIFGAREVPGKRNGVH